MGWASPVSPLAASLDIKFTNGPAGQVSTRIGDPLLVTVSTEPLDPSAGTPSTQFIEGFTPTLITPAVPTFFQIPFTTGLVTLLIPGVATRRIRLLTIDAHIYWSPAMNAPHSGINFQIGDGVIALIGFLSMDHPSDSRAYPGGVDFGLGLGISLQAQTHFANNLIAPSITYQII